MRIFRPGSPFNAWVVGSALAFACFEALNPTIWFSADVLGLARVVAALGDAAAGAILGALLGGIVGAISAGIAARKDPLPPKAAAAAARRFMGAMTAGGIAVGLGAGALDLAITPERASYVACTKIQSQYEKAVQQLRDGENQAAIATVESALPLQKSCNGSAGGKLMQGALYALRGTAYFQIDLLPTRAYADFDRAAKLIDRCEVDYPPGSDRGAMCTGYKVSVERYRTQHFCDEALALANRADNAVYHDPAQAKRLAEQGAAAAGKCKNLLNYAYRGIALAQRAQALVALGQPAASTVRESSALIDRCLKQLGGVRGGLATECRNAQKIVAAARSGRGPGT